MKQGKLKPAVKKMFEKELEALRFVHREVFEGRRTCLIRNSGEYNDAGKNLKDIINRYEQFVGDDADEKAVGVI